jgi:hypothetical protein
MTGPEIVDQVIRRVVSETTHHGTTVSILKGIATDLNLDRALVVEVARTANFYKPEGIVKLARGIRAPHEYVEALEIELGLKRPKSQKN